MNRPDIALKLLQLLNEMKSINTEIVAEQLNVSPGTAHRYLLELSKMPFVTLHKKSSYEGKKLNKLEIALKLLQLLNERKSIDSKLVAERLHVSLRTAQRYLLELSNMPCVISDEKEFRYYLNKDYKLHDSLVNMLETDNSKQDLNRYVNKVVNLKYIFCFMCGNSKKYFFELPMPANTPKNNNNRLNVNKLVSIIRKRLAEKKCSFP
ncbi:MAG: hypothetical protein NDI77_11830 [Geobacteraceae bacterium]|nr:hypothetical protein [Geobacteraceae bacterium]